MQGNNDTATFTSPDDEQFFGAIGRLTISWAHLELGLDCMVEILYRGFEGNTIEPEMPRNLQRKITYLRTAFQKFPIGTKAVEGYLKLLNRVQTAAQTRHDIIHGVVIEQAERSGEAIMVRAIRCRNGVVKKRRFRVTTLDILKAAQEAQDLGGTVLYWVCEIHNLIHELSQQAGTQSR